ncbi:hypothetical protein AK812_SmicGene6557 [Symbiodinium microadriaticum]|uniref:Uncharacterized protein n=1 Tax=Symbiodinium microadriaticum TaxID=2951 RepID=A0A1Q9EQV5_SYMMI|nr:hypothetical protein AK812_SmicGene6557 [Symbiodinium microadriaticum]
MLKSSGSSALNSWSDFSTSSCELAQQIARLQKRTSFRGIFRGGPELVMLAFASAASPSQWDFGSRLQGRAAPVSSPAGPCTGPGQRGTPAYGYLSLALAALAAPRISRGRAPGSRIVRLAEPNPSSYVPILVEIEGDKAYQIEVRPSDTAKIVKAEEEEQEKGE